MYTMITEFTNSWTQNNWASDLSMNARYDAKQCFDINSALFIGNHSSTERGVE